MSGLQTQVVEVLGGKMSPKGVYERTKGDSSFRLLKPLLEELYVIHKLSTIMIAGQFGVSSSIIKYWMNELEIPQRICGGQPTHGGILDGKKKRLYRIWEAMKSRCLNPNREAYKHYGGKGVKVCLEWLNYAVFRDWALINGYADGLTIDRINNDGNYEPFNCQWITLSENARKGNLER